MDRGLQHQQNMGVSGLCIVIIRAPSNRLAHLRPLVGSILKALEALSPGQVREVEGRGTNARAAGSAGPQMTFTESHSWAEGRWQRWQRRSWERRLIEVFHAASATAGVPACPAGVPDHARELPAARG
jgi:hypothetical protein